MDQEFESLVYSIFSYAMRLKISYSLAARPFTRKFGHRHADARVEFFPGVT
jgi:hypothetical protein